MHSWCWPYFALEHHSIGSTQLVANRWLESQVDKAQTCGPVLLCALPMEVTSSPAVHSHQRVALSSRFWLLRGIQAELATSSSMLQAQTRSTTLQLLLSVSERTERQMRCRHPDADSRHWDNAIISLTDQLRVATVRAGTTKRGICHVNYTFVFHVLPVVQFARFLWPLHSIVAFPKQWWSEWLVGQQWQCDIPLQECQCEIPVWFRRTIPT